MQKLLLVYYHSENPKSRHKPNLQNTSKYGFSLVLGGKNGGVLSMRMQVILDSSFARPGSAPIWGGKKGEFRDWTIVTIDSESLHKAASHQNAELWGIGGFHMTSLKFKLQSC